VLTRLTGGKEVRKDASDFRVQVISTDQLPRIERQWNALASNAIESSPFFESWMLVPALDALGNTGEVFFALVWRDSPTNTKAEPVLVGLFPFTTARRLKRLPVRVTEILSHIYCFSGVPLLHQEYSRSALGAYFDWLKTPASSSGLVFFWGLPVDGLFHQLLIDVLYSRSLFSYIARRYTRALYRHPDDPREYITGQFSGKSLKHFRRQKELLTERGVLEFRHLGPQGDVANWTETFLRLEAAGWKGAEGTALGAMESHETFFKRITRAAHERHRLSMSGLWLDGRLIAGRTAFRALDGFYLFKIAYDEDYAKYSPGTLLELEWIWNGGEGEGVWVDSCTLADNPVYRRLWAHRRTIEDLFVSAGSPRSDFALSVLPVLRFVKSRLRRRGAESLSKARNEVPTKG
jgi:hypothetical protein